MRILGGLGLALCVACSSAPPAGNLAAGGPGLAPSGIEGLYYRFDDGMAQRFDGGESRSWPQPAAGQFLGVGYDLAGGRAIAAFDGALASVYLGEESPPEWNLPAPWERRPEAMAVRGNVLATLTSRTLERFDLRNEGMALTLGTLDLGRISSLDGQEPLLAVPDPETEERVVLATWERTSSGGLVKFYGVFCAQMRAELVVGIGRDMMKFVNCDKPIIKSLYAKLLHCESKCRMCANKHLVFAGEKFT